MAQGALGEMMELGEILTGDMPRPGRPSSPLMPNQKLEERVAIAGAPDGAPPLLGTGTGVGATGMALAGRGMAPPGMAMAGCPMMRSQHRCPLTMLEGANALTDDRYQKLYDIKGQFIANIVPKGLEHVPTRPQYEGPSHRRRYRY